MKENNLLQQTIIEGLQEKKGKKIIVADMTKIDGATFDYFIICQGNSTTHVTSIAEEMIDYVKKNDHVKPFAFDGFKNSQWVVIDYGNILVHVFLPETREFYNLEQLWADAKLTDIPDLD
ncbi:MAG: ribosome silencing factor [Bacteroidales bacterium]|nr:ribosome silencing factor [Bacteroidales bacterium]